MKIKLTESAQNFLKHVSEEEKAKMHFYAGEVELTEEQAERFRRFEPIYLKVKQIMHRHMNDMAEIRAKHPEAFGEVE